MVRKRGPAGAAADQRRARDRGTLLGHLQRRQAKHERIIVDAVQVNTYRQADRSGNFSMLLRRTADDIPGGPQLLGGKGGRLRLPSG